ncbi:MAG: TolC family protein [Bacteroidetes bacterium]|nr:TolC family protein [Bacteroidota bacterium]
MKNRNTEVRTFEHSIYEHPNLYSFVIRLFDCSIVCHLLLAVLCLLSCFSFGQTFPLDSVLSRIEKNNPALLSYANKINSATEMVNTAKQWNPAVTGFEIGKSANSYDFNTNTFEPMVFGEQWFPNGKRVRAKENYLKSFAPIKQNEYEYLKNILFAQAKEKYFERYVAEKKIQIIKNNIALMNKMIDLSEKQMGAGMGDLGSIYKMKARLADSQTMLLHEQNLANSLTAEMNSLMFSDLSQQFLLDTNNLIKNYKGVKFLSVKDSLEKKRSDIQKMNSEISSMKLNQTLASLQGKPTYGVRLEHTTSFGSSAMYDAMFQMSIPIFAKSKNWYKSEAKSMGFEISAMEQDKQAMLNMANNMVNVLLLALNTEYAETENYTKNVLPAYKKSFDANLLAYSQNTGDLMKVILALDDLQMGQMKYLEHLGILLKAQADYEKEMQIR